MEVSVCGSPGPALSISREPGEKRAPRWACRGGWGGGSALSTPACPPLQPEAQGAGLCAQGPPWPAVLSWFSGCPWTTLLSEQTEVAAFKEENY